MPRLFQDGHSLSDGPVAIELDGGNEPFPHMMVQFLEKDERSALPVDRKRIWTKAVSGIGKHVPSGARQIPRLQDICRGTVAPADVPMRRVAAQPIYFLRNRSGQSAQNMEG